MRIFAVIVIMTGMMSGQVLYEEYFTGGNMQLDWHPWFTDSLGLGDSMDVINDPTTPGGDDWAGIIRNEYMGMAGLTYAGVSTLTDYSIEAWIFTVVNSGAGGPYNGIALRMNPSSHYYYRLVSDFDSDARLRLGLVASGGMPVALRDWGSGEIPGGVPGSSSWHKLKCTMIADTIWCYYDDQLLPGCPLLNDSVPQGYFGIYTFNMESTASTICDDIIVREAVSAVLERDGDAAAALSVTPNPFSDVVRIELETTPVPDPTSFLVEIYDITGRCAKTYHGTTSSSTHHIFFWDGTSDTREDLPNGVYLVRVRCNGQDVMRKILRVR